MRSLPILWCKFRDMTDDSPESDLLRRRELLFKILRLAGLSAAAGGLGVWFKTRSRRPEEPPPAGLKRSVAPVAVPSSSEMVIARGDSPAQLVRRAIEELGGMGRFVSRGDVVVIKPNIGWDRTPQQAANTNPEVVAETVVLCRDAGAARVVVTDVSCNDPRRCFQRSGIAEAARLSGAEVILPEERRFRETQLHGRILSSWPVFEPFLAADKVINIPIAKHHSLGGLTLGMKNWYGILGGQRQQLHQRINECVVDLAAFMRPALTLMDAYRILVRNGPTGGNLEDVALEKTLIAATDPVAVDLYTAKTWWGMDSQSLPYLRLAAARGLGTLDLEAVQTRIVTV